jgi:hypothetical protein
LFCSQEETQQDSIASHAKRSLPASEDCTPKTTQKLRRIFEGGTEMAAPVGTKPMLIATLSVEEASDSLRKLSIPKEDNPAFRAFSCDGHKTLSNMTKSVPDHVEATQHKSGLRAEKDNKVAAFDGLLQYLQDYRHGLRQLLVNSNVVIIEPVRQSKVRLDNRKCCSQSTCRITGATVKNSNNNSNSSSAASNTLHRQQPILQRHFFYHPIRTNRSLVDEELPDPEKVRHAREIFERTIQMRDSHKEKPSSAGDTNTQITSNNRSLPPKITSTSKSDQVSRKYLTLDTVFRHKRWTDSGTGSLSSGVSSDLSCYETDVETPDTCSRKDTFSSDDDCHGAESDGHYVAPEILERIRAYGTSVTYYGGHVIAASNGPLRSPMTLAIMDEIEESQRSIREERLGVRFRLVKSNSCGSRLELAGTDPTASLPKRPEKTENGTEEGATSPDTGYLRVNEGGSPHGPSDTCLAPETPSNVVFNDIEFEEYEIAEDSLDVIQENDIECNATDEDSRPGPDQATETRPSSTSNVQMTTWASRSVMFEAEQSHQTGPSHSSC